MILDSEGGHYVFEVVLGYQVGDEPGFTIPYLVQADDPSEAEEKVNNCLDEHGIGEVFWIEDLSQPYGLREYMESLEDNGDEAHILLSELTDDDFQEILEG